MASLARVHGTKLSAVTGKTAPAETKNLDTTALLSLHNIREALIREEDSLIFNLMARGHIARNTAVYHKEELPVPRVFSDGRQMCLLEYMLCETEQLHGTIGRYESPDENPFYPTELKPSIFPDIQFPQLVPKPVEALNLNDLIYKCYVDKIVPEVTHERDDGNYGPAALADIQCLQILSRRIHLGIFVAEVKFKNKREIFSEVIRKQDKEKLMEMLTFPAVEDAVIERVRSKTKTQLKHLAGTEDLKIKVDTISEIYRNYIIPLTKENGAKKSGKRGLH